METIEVKGIEYKLVKARDFEVIVRSDNGFINYTKLCQQINDNRRPFSQLKKSETFIRLCIQMENNFGRIRPELPEVSLYEQIKDHIEITETGSSKSEDRNRVAGTYMPRYLLDYVIMTCDISHYKLIHELMDTIDKVAQERQIKFIEELQSNINLQKAKLDKRKIKINDLKSTVERIERQNNNLQETIDELYNMNLSSGVTIRSMDKKLTDVRTAVEEVHNEVSTIKVKDKKLHRTRDVLILYTSPDKPRDHRVRDETQEGYTWIGTFNGQPRNFNASVPRNRRVIFESESNRLDTFRDILEKETISRYIHDKTKYRDILVRDDQIELLFQAITEELNRDETFDSVTNLEETLTTNNVNDAEIRLKQQLLQQHSPLLINLNRYKRRIYANVNDELVLVDTVNNAYNYDWIYRYGNNGTKYGKLDLEILRTSRFTSELETRINYE